MVVYIIIYDYLCVQKESCGFIINGVIVKDEENANYYPARRYFPFKTVIIETVCKIPYLGEKKNAECHLEAF